VTADGGTWPHPRPARRVAPVPPGQRTPEVEEVLRTTRQGLGQTDDMHIFATLAHHPRLFTRWSPFAGTLLFGGDLPARDRELLILRTAWNCRAHYEWGHHVPIAQQVGISVDEIAAVTAGTDDPSWSEDDAVLLRAADELHAGATISDATWDALSRRYTKAQLVELCMLVGHYHLLAFTLNSLGVQLEGPEAGGGGS
jgi:4-carboxymuconolactone decarboxylase